MTVFARRQNQRQCQPSAIAAHPDHADHRHAASWNFSRTRQPIWGNQALQRQLRAQGIRTKLILNRPEDKYEQEADRTAEKIMHMPKAAFSDTTADDQELSASSRAFFEAFFDRDFSDVSLHTGPVAAEAAEAVNAKAFTVGRDIVFGARCFSPHTSEGRRLMAHELTHVVQQQALGTKDRLLQRQGIDIDEDIDEDAYPDVDTADPVIVATGGLLSLDEMLDQINVPEEKVISLLGQLSPSEKQTVLSSTVYKGKMVAALDNNEMASAVDALGAELAVKLDWMAAEGTDYTLVKPRIVAASSSERADVLNKRHILEYLRDGLWSWNDFAKCVELLGRWAPNVATLVMNQQVQNVIEAAWVRSNPGVRVVPVQQYIHEEGGWIYLNIITDGFEFRTKEGGPFTTNLRFPSWVDDSIVMATFHTHPQLGTDFKQVPSPEDIAFGNKSGVPGIIRTEINSQRAFFFYGPPARKHLAGGKPRSWSYPGSSGGVAP